MSQFTLLFASILGGLAVVFGAFGAHALKKILNDEQLKSFETGVKYQFYHAIILLIIGFNFSLESASEKYMVYSLLNLLHKLFLVKVNLLWLTKESGKIFFKKK